MRCMLCGSHAEFEHTVFQGTSPTTVRLCDPCATKVQVQEKVTAIKSAPDKGAKQAAVAELLRAVGK